MGSDARAIAQLFEAFMAAFNGADLERLRAMYTDDAIVMAPGQPALRGPESIIQQMWAPMFGDFEVEAELPIDEIQSSDGWGYVCGTFRMQLNPRAGGEAIRDNGQYIDVVRQAPNGDWKIARAIWNSIGD